MRVGDTPRPMAGSAPQRAELLGRRVRQRLKLVLRGAENRRGLGGYGFVGSELHFSSLRVNSGGGLVCKVAVYSVADLRAYAGRWHVISDWLRFKHF